jgi:hypothetical protein
LRIVRLAGPQAVLSAQHGLDVRHRERHGGLATREDVDVVEPVGAEQAEANGAQRDQYLVVGIRSHRCPPSRRQHAGDVEQPAAPPVILTYAVVELICEKGAA